MFTTSIMIATTLLGGVATSTNDTATVLGMPYEERVELAAENSIINMNEDSSYVYTETKVERNAKEYYVKEEDVMKGMKQISKKKAVENNWLNALVFWD